MIKDALGDRMKRYEAVTKTTLVSRMPVIIRLDGVAFHTFTKGFEKPFDNVMIKAMQKTMQYLCEHIQGCVLGYTQSDEITLVLVDYEKLNSDAWYSNEVQKIVSVSASMATYAFNKYFNDLHLERVAEHAGTEDRYDLAHDISRRKGAYFDARVFNIPREDATNCVFWRQKDAERNSINSLAQSLFSHRSLQGLGLKQTLTKIEQEKGIIWGNLATTYKRGSCYVRQTKYKLPDGQIVTPRSRVTYQGKEGVIYFDGNGYYFYENETDINSELKGEPISVEKVHNWFLDNHISMFRGEGRRYVDELIYPEEEEQ